MVNNLSSREDILKELFNISVGKSASILSEIVSKKIILNVPDVKILDSQIESGHINRHLSNIVEGALMISSISFKENLTGKANLIFPADRMRKFINLCSDENGVVNDGSLDFNDIDFDIIKEIGNIILNSIIGEIGNFIDVKLEYTLPEVRVLDKLRIDNLFYDTGYEFILILSITFKIEDSEIIGAVLINLTLNSLDEIISRTYQMEEELNK